MLSLRLLGNPTQRAIVQVSDGLSWGRICSESWKYQHANMVCKQFGYAGALTAISIPFERSQEPPKEAYVNLSGYCSESIDECSKLAITNKCNCQSDDAGIICRKYKSKSNMQK